MKLEKLFFDEKKAEYLSQKVSDKQMNFEKGLRGFFN